MTSRGLGGRRGFTLMELLVVLGIIAILMGFVAPAFFRTRVTAKVTKTKNEVKKLEDALRLYLDEYKVWPTTGLIEDNAASSYAGGGTKVYEISGALCNALQGGDNGMNAKQYPFFTYTPYASAPDHDAMYDPFGIEGKAGSWLAYRTAFDLDYNNQIMFNGTNVYRSVIVWSYGPDRILGTEDDIRSWD